MNKLTESLIDVTEALHDFADIVDLHDDEEYIDLAEEAIGLADQIDNYELNNGRDTIYLIDELAQKIYEADIKYQPYAEAIWDSMADLQQIVDESTIRTNRLGNRYLKESSALDKVPRKFKAIMAKVGFNTPIEFGVGLNFNGTRFVARYDIHAKDHGKENELYHYRDRLAAALNTEYDYPENLKDFEDTLYKYKSILNENLNESLYDLFHNRVDAQERAIRPFKAIMDKLGFKRPEEFGFKYDHGNWFGVDTYAKRIPIEGLKQLDYYDSCLSTLLDGKHKRKLTGSEISYFEDLLNGYKSVLKKYHIFINPKWRDEYYDEEE